MDLVTAATRSSLPGAFVLADSWQTSGHAKHPATVLVVDAVQGEVASTDSWRIITPADLDIDPLEFAQLATIYRPEELCAVMRPWALDFTLRSGRSHALYLSQRSRVYGDLQWLDQAMAGHDAAITPYRLSPTPADDLQPRAEDILNWGIHSLGLVVVSQGAASFLEWWKGQVSRSVFGGEDLHRRLRSDEQWVDLGLSYFDIAVLRDPALNVAYWNLDERRLTRVDEHWLINGQPLRTFDFEGFDPEQPWTLSAAALPAPRVVASEVANLLELCSEYAEERRAATDNTQPPASRFVHLSDGTVFTPQMRDVYRTALREAEQADTIPPPPAFGPRGSQDLEQWATERLGPGTAANHWLRAVWLLRVDLHRLAPDPVEFDSSEFLIQWARSHGVQEGYVPSAWAPAIKPPPDPRFGQRATQGVTISGYMHGELGVGELGRSIVRAAERAETPHSVFVSHRLSSRQRHPFDSDDTQTRYSTNLVALAPDQIGRWRVDFGPSSDLRAYTVGVWAWELPDFPPRMVRYLELVDEVWAVSNFVANAVRQRTDKPVKVLPLSIPDYVAEGVEVLDRDFLSIPRDRPYQLFMFDQLSDMERKNPLGLIDAFAKAFPENDGPVLVIKSLNGERNRAGRERLRQTAARATGVLLLEDYLSPPQRLALINECQAYVSLHRSEGYGLTMAEAMMLGRPTIATGYSGNLDFMTEESSVLIPYELVAVAGSAAYPDDSVWAQPDIPAAAAAMNRVHSDPQWASSLGDRARLEALDICAIQRTADFLRDQLPTIDDIVDRRIATSEEELRRSTWEAELAEKETQLVARTAELEDELHREVARRELAESALRDQQARLSHRLAETARRALRLDR